ncbi:FepA family TonB-dependent siderophore receptor [Moraxella cuniculi]|uniref:Enterobactin outer-membrane receptor n=1 Tax=Moraxella cuniculi TaxID=34061 RepID=A0A3S4QRL8_9GAMM|nr:FepA family TonB-dependent siderophore receptor [Moraxella cuniculi]VEG12695.1 Enterobactin outer-membrane receptor [Moraxella cuniculi]
MSNFQPKSLALCIFACMSGAAFANTTEETAKTTLPTVVLPTQVVTAEAQVKQSLGVSTITGSDFDRTPVKNDVAEIVRKMPGVNLTGNSVGGARGNNRQIDIRGMGPENTLILIDGKPVSSRNSVRYSWGGERDTRGDSQWIPSGAIESIEVLRGPAAARYGSGAMGGVVNIRTKKITDTPTGSVSVYTSQPENSKEGDSVRVNATLSAPIIDNKLGMRVYAGYNKTDADDVDINPVVNGRRAAGREGVINKDAGLRLAYQINPNHSLTLDSSYGRQGNIYAGDTQSNGYDAANNNPMTPNRRTGVLEVDQTAKRINNLVGAETNTMYRQSHAITHEGEYANNISSKLIAQYDYTRNYRQGEGLAGGGEGAFNSDDKFTSRLKTKRLSGEVVVPFYAAVPNVLTVGAEYVGDDFNDPVSTVMADSSGLVQLPSNRADMNSRIYSVYAEDNITLGNDTDLVLALRYDNHNKSGSNFSPAMNITHRLTDGWTIKGGIAKAYKAPNMYQTAPGYLLFTRGNGCPVNYTYQGNAYNYAASGQATRINNCYLMANEDLKPETAINSELGVQFKNNKVNASLTWFRSDYKNKIASGNTVLGRVTRGQDTYNLLQWENVPKALVQGVEGSITYRFDKASWTNNLTYIMDSKNKTTGNPLSIIPRYTWNSILNYQVSDKVDVVASYTHYGKQKPRQFAEGNMQIDRGLDLTEVKAYGIAGINAGYRFNDNISARVGVENLFDKQLLRIGNQTYNEAGRSYFASIKYQF